jgi:large subunit ribosomal protein L15
VKPWFEGGQTPITKLFPKIGFKRVSALELNVLNLDRVLEFHRAGRLGLREGEVLNMRKMKQLGLITGPLKDGVKILANGKEEYDLPIKIEATRASTEAIRAIERAGGEFTAKYFTKLSLRAHLHPEYFFLKRGYVPLEARPTKRREVHYYSRVDKRGFLVKENHPLLQAIQDAKTSKPKTFTVKAASLENLGSTVNEAAEGFQNSGIFKLSDLKI